MRSILSASMQPGMRLMAQFSLGLKMALMALAMVVPLGVLLLSQGLAWQADTAFVEDELEGLRAVKPAQGLIAALQMHLGLVQRVAAGEAAAPDELARAKTRLRSAVQAMDQASAGLQRIRLDDAWTPLRKRLLALAERPAAATDPQWQATHAELIDAARQLLELGAERSRLLLDPEMVSYTLMDLSVERLPLWLEALAEARGHGAALLARGGVGSTERFAMQARTRTVTDQLRNVQHKLDALVRNGSERPASWEQARLATEQFAEAATRQFEAERLDGDAPQFFEAGTHAIAMALRLNDEALAALETELLRREQTILRHLVVSMAVCMLGAALLGYLALSFYRSFRHSLGTLLQSLDALAAGRLSQCVPTHGRDELAQVGRSVETMGERLSAMVSEIRSSAVRVGQAGQHLADEGAALSRRTESQATNLRGSIRTIGQLSSAVAANAEAAVALDGLVDTLGRRTGEGSQAMQQTIASIATLQDTARRVAEINGVIDDIAFQTNLLALNASVEAARAGESGKGFAVVAAEVRQLAQRCAESAGETRELIAGITEQVSQCSARALEVDGALRVLVAGVGEVSARLQQISSASVEQSQGLGGVARSVGSLDDITRENAAAVERTSLASQSLVTQAQALRQSVAAIHLRQGSADEAHEMVERARQRITELGWESACREFNDAGGPFVDRDMYLFVIDRDGRYVAFSARPEWVGRTVHEVSTASSASVDHFLEQAWEAASQGSGWIEYQVNQPDTGEPAAKTAYIARVDDEVLMGCGVYRQDTDPSAAPAGKAAGSAAPAQPARPATRSAAHASA
ncbi:MAG TPA: methyl-accepting chemotaxis protein [Burkholderiaceae bacterium]|nr:methyl-accepting chemotaxis protein [Burkholderiaceae bacterium]